MSAVSRTLVAIVWLAAAAIAADPPAGSDWKFEHLHLKNGSVVRGLILEETPAAVRFQNVRQRPGRPTVVLTTTFARREIDRVERLGDEDRERLRARLAEVEAPGQAERQRMERLGLEPIPWDGTPDAGRRYRSDHFVLESDAPEAVLRRTAVRLEQVYDAFARFLPPRATNPPPTEITLLRSRSAYEARLKALGLRFVNVAYYDPVANRIVCASELERLGEELERHRRKHADLRHDLDRQEAALTKLYKGKELLRHIKPIRDLRQKIEVADRHNEGQFDQATAQLFAVLYHEAFHAYLAGCVYPPPHPEPPRWLNEGLAQIFETAVVEAGELRVGHADRDRLGRVKDALRKGELVPVEQLLMAEARQFQAVHAGDRGATGQFYLTAWAVAFHLTFERRLLGTEALDYYVATQKPGTDPRPGFERLVGTTVEAYGDELRRYLGLLQPDGTARAAVAGNP